MIETLAQLFSGYRECADHSDLGRYCLLLFHTLLRAISISHDVAKGIVSGIPSGKFANRYFEELMSPGSTVQCNDALSNLIAA
jgi:hypothetical protein